MSCLWRLPLPACALLCALPAAQPPKKNWPDAEVMAVHNSALLIDTHNDVPLRVLEGLDFGRRSNTGHTDLARMREGGMSAQFFAAYVAAGFVRENRAANRALRMIDAIRTGIVERNAGQLALATTADEILAARKTGKIAALIGIEGGHAIEDDLGLLRMFFQLGVRYMTLTHFNHNSWATSSGEEAVPPGRPPGLTAFGRQVIAEMNRLGMMVDVAHVSDATFQDVMEASRAPVFNSHSACRALSDIPRNMSDDMIRQMARKGGLILINAGCEFLSPESAAFSPMLNPAAAAKVREKVASIADPKERGAAARKITAEMEAQMPRASIAGFVAHIAHVKRIAGVDFVGLGSDFDGVSCVPEGLEDVSKWPNLTRALLENGYTPAEIRKIYGENMLRFMRAVEEAGRKLRAAR
jgi:membrane dipeptidase